MLNSIIGLRFAMRDGAWVSIRDVPSGLACRARCPACGTRLLAKKGRKQQHHFAHYRVEQCAGGLETGLHLLAKTIIAEKKGLQLPAVPLHKSGYLRGPHWLSFDSSKIEKTLDNIQADVYLQKAKAVLAVEVKVTHVCSAAKQHYYIREGINAVEIDAMAIYSSLLSHNLGDSLAAFKQAIIHSSENRNWLFHRGKHYTEYKQRKQAELRKVILSKQNDYHHYHVYRCPRRLRFVRRGFREGQAYARVFQDCLHCVHCLNIEYEQTWAGFGKVNGLPLVVHCKGEHGHEKGNY